MTGEPPCLRSGVERSAATGGEKQGVLLIGLLNGWDVVDQFDLSLPEVKRS